MKKYLPVLAALDLVGCAHWEYRATYLEEYAGYDSYKLRMERLTVEVELDPRWRQGYSSRNSAASVHLFTVSSIRTPYTIYETYARSIDVNPAKVRRQKGRIRNHAKWQALVQMERYSGSHHDVCGPKYFGVLLG